MRIVSLIPSATEIVYALGLEADLVGVTFECDFPPDPRPTRDVVVGGLDSADLEPLHILTTASIAHIQQLLPDSDVAVDRFRPSLLIDCGDDVGLLENDWEGRTATVGGATIRFGSTAPRCVMTTRAQPGLTRDKAVLQTIAAANKRPFGGFGDFPSLGIYAEIVEPGPVEIGDTLTFV